jgi:hypothetical protein
MYRFRSLRSASDSPCSNYRLSSEFARIQRSVGMPTISTFASLSKCTTRIMFMPQASHDSRFMPQPSHDSRSQSTARSRPEASTTRFGVIATRDGPGLMMRRWKASLSGGCVWMQAVFHASGLARLPFVFTPHPGLRLRRPASSLCHTRQSRPYDEKVGCVKPAWAARGRGLIHERKQRWRRRWFGRRAQQSYHG